MAVAEMSVMTLVALSRDKGAILDGLQKCGAAQIRSSAERELAQKGEAITYEKTDEQIERVEKAVSVICSAVDALKKDERPNFEKDGFGVTKAEFFAMSERGAEFSLVVDAVEKNAQKRAEINAAITAYSAQLKTYEPYLQVDKPFSYFQDTKKTAVYFGSVVNDKLNGLISGAQSGGCVLEVLATVRGAAIIALVAHKNDSRAAEDMLSQAGFRRCPFDGETTAEAETDAIYKAVAALKKEDGELAAGLISYSDKVKDLKLYADYLNFCKEKIIAENMFGKTQSAFVLEAYVPTEATKAVDKAVHEVSDAVFTEFASVPRDGFAPTLNKNGKIVNNFEVVTNMYSSPAYGALDPNAVMSFFFSLFMGVIMADVGYGILMAVGGFLLAAKSRKGTGINRMAKVFAYGGFFAAVFGVLFDSWLGFPLLRSVLGEEYNAFYAAHLDQVTANASIMGINVPAILMWCLGLGTAHMAIGLILKAVQSFQRGKVAEGVFGGLIWAIALFALIVWVYGIATDATFTTYAAYVLLGAVVIGILTAGIGEKGFGKVTKSFTSAYGLINYVSDILSYARLYGLMLAGAQIASIFTNTLAIGMLFPSGVVGIIFGVILIIVGNVFNLAINLLGAYIHDARLQYVEFFGKFYEGEGELFTPFGSKQKHSYFRD